MNIIYVDDEINAIENFKISVKNIKHISNLNCFTSPVDALEFVKNNLVHIAFVDIEMPVWNGPELASRLFEINKDIAIVFVTAYDQYALQAYKLGIIDYILKPYTIEDLEKTFIRLNNILKIDKQSIFFKTFGFFDLFINDKTVFFSNTKAKELLALLVMKKGTFLSNYQIFNYLWENKEYTSDKSTYVRRTTKALISQLKDYNIDHIIKDERNFKCLDLTNVTCDYFEILKGNKKYISDYHGEFMTQYSWGEVQIPIIDNKIKMLLEYSENHK